jgi:hypothetical protein
MRSFVIAGIFTAFLLPAIPASACEDGAAQSTSIVTTGLSAAAKKGDKKNDKTAVKKMKKAPKQKVEYMRAAPMK